MYCDLPDFGRCCFCLPLRRGVLVFGYINVIFCAFMIGVYSYWTHKDLVGSQLVYHGLSADTTAGVSIAIYCIELIVNCLLLYGAHLKRVYFIKIFFYYTVTTTVAAFVLQIVNFCQMPHPAAVIEMGAFTFAGICIQVYLIFLVRSLLRKMEMDGPHRYDNQLHTIVSGEAVANGVYNNCTVVPSQINKPGYTECVSGLDE